MSAPDPEGMSLLSKVMIAATAIVTPLWGGHKYLENKFDKKADKAAVKEAFEQLNSEMTIQRGNIGKLFDQSREEAKANEARHRELMMHLLEKK